MQENIQEKQEQKLFIGNHKMSERKLNKIKQYLESKLDINDKEKNGSVKVSYCQDRQDVEIIISKNKSDELSDKFIKSLSSLKLTESPNDVHYVENVDCYEYCSKGDDQPFNTKVRLKSSLEGFINLINKDIIAGAGMNRVVEFIDQDMELESCGVQEYKNSIFEGQTLNSERYGFGRMIHQVNQEYQITEGIWNRNKFLTQCTLQEYKYLIQGQKYENIDMNELASQIVEQRQKKIVKNQNSKQQQQNIQHKDQNNNMNQARIFSTTETQKLQFQNNQQQQQQYQQQSNHKTVNRQKQGFQNDNNKSDTKLSLDDLLAIMESEKMKEGKLCEDINTFFANYLGGTCEKVAERLKSNEPINLKGLNGIKTFILPQIADRGWMAFKHGDLLVIAAQSGKGSYDAFYYAIDTKGEAHLVLHDGAKRHSVQTPVLFDSQGIAECVVTACQKKPQQKNTNITNIKFHQDDTILKDNQISEVCKIIHENINDQIKKSEQDNQESATESKRDLLLNLASATTGRGDAEIQNIKAEMACCNTRAELKYTTDDTLLACILLANFGSKVKEHVFENNNVFKNNSTPAVSDVVAYLKDPENKRELLNAVLKKDAGYKIDLDPLATINNNSDYTKPFDILVRNAKLYLAHHRSNVQEKQKREKVKLDNMDTICRRRDQAIDLADLRQAFCILATGDKATNQQQYRYNGYIIYDTQNTQQQNQNTQQQNQNTQQQQYQTRQLRQLQQQQQQYQQPLVNQQKGTTLPQIDLNTKGVVFDETFERYFNSLFRCCIGGGNQKTISMEEEWMHEEGMFTLNQESIINIQSNLERWGIPQGAIKVLMENAKQKNLITWAEIYPELEKAYKIRQFMKVVMANRWYDESEYTVQAIPAGKTEILQTKLINNEGNEVVINSLQDVLNVWYNKDAFEHDIRSNSKFKCNDFTGTDKYKGDKTVKFYDAQGAEIMYGEKQAGSSGYENGKSPVPIREAQLAAFEEGVKVLKGMPEAKQQQYNDLNRAKIYSNNSLPQQQPEQQQSNQNTKQSQQQVQQQNQNVPKHSIQHTKQQVNIGNIQQPQLQIPSKQQQQPQIPLQEDKKLSEARTKIKDIITSKKSLNEQGSGVTFEESGDYTIIKISNIKSGQLKFKELLKETETEKGKEKEKLYKKLGKTKNGEKFISVQTKDLAKIATLLDNNLPTQWRDRYQKNNKNQQDQSQNQKIQI